VQAFHLCRDFFVAQARRLVHQHRTHCGFAQITIDLFNNHVIDERYAIEKASGGSKTRQEVSDIFLNRPDKDANILLSLRPNVTGCVRSVTKKWIVIYASMNWLSLADAAQNKYYGKKMIWLNLPPLLPA